MAQATLAAELEALVPEGDEATSRALFAAAYAGYAADAQAATPILPAGVALGQAAMEPALVGMSLSGNAVTAWSTGLRAFWVGVAAGLATSFAGATVITPPPLPGLEVLLTAAFAANLASSASLEDAADALATAIHSVVAGGSVTVGAVTTPIV